MEARLVFDHLAELTTPIGLFEHARFASPRVEHGFCLDDVARALVVTSRERNPSDVVAGLQRSYLAFTLLAQDPDGRFRNRRAADGTWTDEPTVDDHWGRAIWALGVVARTGEASARCVAADAALRGLRLRSPHWHATAYAALGAAELLAVRPDDTTALAFLRDARASLRQRDPDPSWPWPDTRLTYANAVLPEALIAVGAALRDARTSREGLTLLGWLADRETNDDRVSPTPVGGWAPGEPRPGFDQQPIEVAALAEALRRAHEATGDERWLRLLDRCVGWFHGRNDAGMALYDPVTGAGRDGLHAHHVNENQGAESTIAALSTLQLGLLTDAGVAA